MSKKLIGLLLIMLGCAFAATACFALPIESRPSADSTAAPAPAPTPTPVPKPAAETTAAPIGSNADSEDSASAEATPVSTAAVPPMPTPVATELPQPEETPEPPAASPIPNEQVKLDSFSFADNDLVPVDLDYDGVIETVSLVSNLEKGSMRLVIDSDQSFELNLDISSLVCAYVTDFCFGDGSAELIVSYVNSMGDYVTAIVGSFTSSTPISSSNLDGWVESLSEDGIRLCRTASILGTRGISRLYTYNTVDGSVIPLETEWCVYSYDSYVSVARPLTAVFAGEEGDTVITLEEGTLLIPTATDFFSYIAFRTSDGKEGYISAVSEDGEFFLDGEPLDSFFNELPAL